MVETKVVAETQIVAETHIIAIFWTKRKCHYYGTYGFSSKFASFFSDDAPLTIIFSISEKLCKVGRIFELKKSTTS